MSFLSLAVVFSFTPGHLVLHELIAKSVMLEIESMNGAQFGSHSTDFAYEGVFRTTTSIVPFTIPAFVHGTTVLVSLSVWLAFSPFGKPIAFGCRIRPDPLAFTLLVRKSKPEVVDITKRKRKYELKTFDSLRHLHLQD